MKLDKETTAFLKNEGTAMYGGLPVEGPGYAGPAAVNDGRWRTSFFVTVVPERLTPFEKLRDGVDVAHRLPNARDQDYVELSHRGVGASAVARIFEVSDTTLSETANSILKRVAFLRRYPELDEVATREVVARELDEKTADFLWVLYSTTSPRQAAEALGLDEKNASGFCFRRMRRLRAVAGRHPALQELLQALETAHQAGSPDKPRWGFLWGKQRWEENLLDVWPA